MNHHKSMSVESGKNEKGEQVVEGRIDDIVAFEAGGWEKILRPLGLDIGDVHIYLKSEGGGTVHYWHIDPELMEDKNKAEIYKKEREMWTEE